MHVFVIDSHTAGEPTRIVIRGGPDLGSGPLVERRELFRAQHDDFRAAMIDEPRGSESLVGGLLVEPTDPTCTAGVIFFNNVGVIGMCGHGTIGLVATLAHQGRIMSGDYRIETPVGIVGARLYEDGRVTLENVPSRRVRTNVLVDVPAYGQISGDVAWGGNWFFLIDLERQQPPLDVKLERGRVAELTRFCKAIRSALVSHKIAGADGNEIDHIALFGPPARSDADSRNFVLCPGGAYDRSPCGTGLSAKLACLFADGRLREGQTWRQESITGTLFEGQIRRAGEGIVPLITGTAYITAESKLLFDPEDPLV